jgi:hypothetical protein
MACLLAICLTACHKEEQEVAGAAENAVQAEHKAQAAAQASASEQDRERAELALIPLPTKSMYVNVRDAGAWANPFLSVGASSLSLRISVTGANPGTAGQAGGSHTKSAHYHEVQLRPADLAQALIALPPGAWRYGRVIAVAESPQASPKDRPKVRRNVEAAIQQLNDLGIVVEEWPAR